MLRACLFLSLRYEAEFLTRLRHTGSAMAELGRLLIYEASRDWLVIFGVLTINISSISLSLRAKCVIWAGLVREYRVRIVLELIVEGDMF
jgi:hypothetical protein